MKIQELKKKSIAELQELLSSELQHVLELRFKKTQGRASDVNEIKKTKKDIARILTILSNHG